MADMQELGALWRKISERTGGEYFTGDIALPGGEKVKIVAFTNDRKTKENQPDIRIYLSEERGSGNRGGSAPSYSRPAAPSRSAPQPAHSEIAYPTEDIDPEDIPF